MPSLQCPFYHRGHSAASCQPTFCSSPRSSIASLCVVPIAGQWCPLQVSGTHCKQVRPIANLWSQFWCPLSRSCLPDLAWGPDPEPDEIHLDLYFHLSISRGFSWYQGKPIEQDWHARFTFCQCTVELERIEGQQMMMQVGGQHGFSWKVRTDGCQGIKGIELVQFNWNLDLSPLVLP